MSVNKYQDINATLAYLFTKSMFNHPDQLEALPDNAQVVMQIEGYGAFNRWSRQLAASQPASEDQPVVYAVFRFKPEFTPRQASSRRLVTSEIENLQLQPA